MRLVSIRTQHTDTISTADRCEYKLYGTEIQGFILNAVYVAKATITLNGLNIVATDFFYPSDELYFHD